MAFNLAQGKTDIRAFNGSELLSPTFSLPYLRNQNLGEDAGRVIKPNPTKHQFATWKIKNSTQYKHELDMFLPSPKPNFLVTTTGMRDLSMGLLKGRRCWTKYTHNLQLKT